MVGPGLANDLAYAGEVQKFRGFGMRPREMVTLEPFFSNCAVLRGDYPVTPMRFTLRPQRIP